MIFSYYNNGTLKHRDSESFRGCNKPVSCFLQVFHHITFRDSSLLMSWHDIIFTLAPHARCLAADDAFTGFSDKDRRRCRSVAQTSALLHGNEWTSLRTFAVALRLELV